MAGETVLIIEDRRENIVHLANNVLKPNGYNVITAMDGQRGLNRILTDGPDLVILDLNMPKMDGLEVLAALKDRQVQIPVILTTFYGSEQVAQQALRLGAVDYIVKPYDITDMLRAVEQALASRPRPTAPANQELPMAAAGRKEPDERDESIPLTRQVERWMRDMNILTRVGKALVSRLSMEHVLVRCVEAAIYITRADHAFLLLGREGEPAALRLRAARGPRDPEVRILDQELASSLAREVVQTGKTTYHRRESDAGLMEVADALLAPPIAAPLRWRGETVGVLIAARESGEPGFTESDMEWLSGLADYAAIAVRNARTCRQRSQPPPSSPVNADEQTLATMREELERLASELQTATETVQRLAGLLDGASQDS